MRELGAKKNLIRVWREMEKKVSDLYDLVCLAEKEGDSSLSKEINMG